MKNREISSKNQNLDNKNEEIICNKKNLMYISSMLDFGNKKDNI